MAYFQLKFPKIMVFAQLIVFVKLIYEKMVYTTLVHVIFSTQISKNHDFCATNLICEVNI